MSRKYKTILATMAVLFLAGGAALAQEPGNSGAESSNDGDRGKRMAHRGQRESMRPEHMIRMMTRRLELDDAQAEQVRNIVSGARPEFDALREKGRANREAMRDLDVEDADYDAKLQNLSIESGELATSSAELRGRIRAEIHAILTPEQREEFKAASERGESRGQRNRDRDHRRQGTR